MRLDEAHLRKNAKYRVRVRAIPKEGLQGTWSEWSEPYNFSTPPGKSKSVNSASHDDCNKTFCLFPSENTPNQILWETYAVIVCLVLIVVVTFSVVLSLKRKYDISAHLISKCQLAKCSDLIFLSFTELLPMFGQAFRILNKHYCRPATQIQYVSFSSLLKQLFFYMFDPLLMASLRDPPCLYSLFSQGLLLNVKPDVFSILKVYSTEEIEPVEESDPLDVADVDQPSLPCSSLSSDSRSADSVSTEDLEVSALLSRSSSEEDGSLQSAAPSPVEAPGTPQSERDGEGKGTVFGVSKQEEAYVTMSSFYQINKSAQKQ